MLMDTKQEKCAAENPAYIVFDSGNAFDSYCESNKNSSPETRQQCKGSVFGMGIICNANGV